MFFSVRWIQYSAEQLSTQTPPEQRAFLTASVEQKKKRPNKWNISNDKRCPPETRQVSAGEWLVGGWRDERAFHTNRSRNPERWAQLLSVHYVSSSDRESPQLTWESTVQRAAPYCSTARSHIDTLRRSCPPVGKRSFHGDEVFVRAVRGEDQPFKLHLESYMVINSCYGSGIKSQLIDVKTWRNKKHGNMGKTYSDQKQPLRNPDKPAMAFSREYTSVKAQQSLLIPST